MTRLETSDLALETDHPRVAYITRKGGDWHGVMVRVQGDDAEAVIASARGGNWGDVWDIACSLSDVLRVSRGGRVFA